MLFWVVLAAMVVTAMAMLLTVETTTPAFAAEMVASPLATMATVAMEAVLLVVTHLLLVLGSAGSGCC